jgi:hypothetical protein
VSDFRVTRIKISTSANEIRPEPGPANAEPLTVALEPLDYTLLMTLDFEYFDEPISIEPPERYIRLNGQSIVIFMNDR